MINLYTFIKAGLFSMHLTHSALLIYSLESEIYNRVNVEYSEYLPNIALHQCLLNPQTSLSFYELPSPYNDWSQQRK